MCGSRGSLHLKRRNSKGERTETAAVIGLGVDKELFSWNWNPWIDRYFHNMYTSLSDVPNLSGFC